mmetsp:Transcript_39513/g.111968  ORF Transcript_39513/g.111968 Transcript_39513/m.111968 type:complete len:222 (+) Transcript_39513:191-856(+)
MSSSKSSWAKAICREGLLGHTTGVPDVRGASSVKSSVASSVPIRAGTGAFASGACASGLPLSALYNSNSASVMSSTAMTASSPSTSSPIKPRSPALAISFIAFTFNRSSSSIASCSSASRRSCALLLNPSPPSLPALLGEEGWSSSSPSSVKSSGAFALCAGVATGLQASDMSSQLSRTSASLTDSTTLGAASASAAAAVVPESSPTMLLTVQTPSRSSTK